MTTRLDAANAVIRRTGLPSGWNEFALGSLARVIGGGTPDRNESAYWRDGGIPWITPTDLTANAAKYIEHGAEHISEAGLENSNATLVPVGSIVFSTRGTVGNIAIARVPLTTNQSCEVLAPIAGAVNGDFLYYLLNFGLFAFHRLACGTTFGSITRRDLARVRFAIPAPDEQAAIARILDAVDQCIEQARVAAGAARQVKDSITQTFFYSALGVTAYADRPTQKLPPGWSLLNAESLLSGEPKNGVSPQATAQGRGVPTFSIAAVRHGRVDLSTEANLKYAEVPPRVADKFRLATGDVLVVRGNANPDLVGKAGIVSTVPHGCIYPDITKRITLRQSGENTVSPEYFVLAWNHSMVHNQVLRRAKTSNGTLKINSRDVKQIVIPVPPSSRQKEIVELVSATEKTVDALGQKISSLEQLKKSLLHDLLTGTVLLDPALFTEPPT